METFDQIYNRLFKQIFSYLVCKAGSVSAAEDIASKTWQKVFEKFTHYDSAKGSYEQWVFTIARNESNKYFRFFKTRTFFSLTGYEDMFDSGENIETKLIQEEEKAQIAKIIKILDTRERDIISLKFNSGFNNRQIAEIVNLSPSNVGTILNRALGKIKKQFGDHYD